MKWKKKTFIWSGIRWSWNLNKIQYNFFHTPKILWDHFSSIFRRKDFYMKKKIRQTSDCVNCQSVDYNQNDFQWKIEMFQCSQREFDSFIHNNNYIMKLFRFIPPLSCSLSSVQYSMLIVKSFNGKYGRNFNDVCFFCYINDRQNLPENNSTEN